MTADTSTQAHGWLTEAVAAFADDRVRLDLLSKGRPGNPGLRAERAAAQRLLRLTLARAVYEENPRWEYQRQYREFMAREREALSQARDRVDARVIEVIGELAAKAEGDGS